MNFLTLLTVLSTLVDGPVKALCEAINTARCRSDVYCECVLEVLGYLMTHRPHLTRVVLQECPCFTQTFRTFTGPYDDLITSIHLTFDPDICAMAATTLEHAEVVRTM